MEMHANCGMAGGKLHFPTCRYGSAVLLKASNKKTGTEITEDTESTEKY
jgi:hypothetical protein